MNSIDNFEKIKNIMTFESDDEFYYLQIQILQRRKENDLLTSNSRVIKNYYVTSVKYLDDFKDEIVKFCELFNARAMIRLNKRSFKQCAFKSLEKITNQIMNEDYKSVRRFYDKVSGKYNKDKNKTWIIDIDQKDYDDTMLYYYLNNRMPDGDKVVEVISSKDGYHVITKPFDCSNFKEKFTDLDLHKDNPTNLYIPLSIADEIKQHFEANFIPTTKTDNEVCDKCSSNPKNGGSGICNCILGIPEIR